MRMPHYLDSSDDKPEKNFTAFETYAPVAPPKLSRRQTCVAYIRRNRLARCLTDTNGLIKKLIDHFSAYLHLFIASVAQTSRRRHLHHHIVYTIWPTLDPYFALGLMDASRPSFNNGYGYCVPY